MGDILQTTNAPHRMALYKTRAAAIRAARAAIADARDTLADCAAMGARMESARGLPA